MAPAQLSAKMRQLATGEMGTASMQWNGARAHPRSVHVCMCVYTIIYIYILRSGVCNKQTNTMYILTYAIKNFMTCTRPVPTSVTNTRDLQVSSI